MTGKGAYRAIISFVIIKALKIIVDINGSFQPKTFSKS